MHVRTILLTLNIVAFGISTAFANLGDTESQNSARFTTKPIKVVAVDDKTHINVYHENGAFYFNVINADTCVMEAVWSGAMSAEGPDEVSKRFHAIYMDKKLREHLTASEEADGYYWVSPLDYPKVDNHRLYWLLDYMVRGRSDHGQDSSIPAQMKFAQTLYEDTSFVPPFVIMSASDTSSGIPGNMIAPVAGVKWALVFCTTGHFMYPNPKTRIPKAHVVSFGMDPKRHEMHDWSCPVEGSIYRAAFNKIWEIRGDLEILEHQTPSGTSIQSTATTPSITPAQHAAPPDLEYKSNIGSNPFARPLEQITHDETDDKKELDRKFHGRPIEEEFLPDGEIYVPPEN